MSNDLRVMLVEDDVAVSAATAQMLGLAGFALELHGSPESALRNLKEFFPGILLIDFQRAGVNGIALLERALKIDRALPVIIITAGGDISIAVRAMHAGAYDFLEKPVSDDLLVSIVKQAMEKRRLTLHVSDLRRRLEPKTGIDSALIGDSPSMVALRNNIRKLFDVAPDVLIHGETGAGKELVARALHDCSPVRSGPFVAINCGAIPETMFESELFGHEKGAFTGAQTQRIGKIEYASGGTLFLDEVEAMPMAMQVKLLRVLQFRQLERLGSNRLIDVPVRVVAATKTDLKAASDMGQFRSDLYFRFNVVTLFVPPLRERREDIPQLFEHHVLLAAARYNRKPPVVTDQLMRDLVLSDWPGNVRELGNVADRFVLNLLGGRFSSSSTHENENKSLKDVVGDFERGLIVETLRKHHGGVLVASESLGIPKKTLYDKMRRYALSEEEYR